MRLGLYENTGDTRNALMLTLASRGASAVVVLARHDKHAHISEDLAELYRHMGQEIPEDAIVAPGATEIVDTKQARQIMYCLDREDIETVVNFISRIDAELFEKEDQELFQLLLCENPDIETAIYNQLESCDEPQKQCLLLQALDRIGSRGHGFLPVIASALQDVALWSPNGQIQTELRTETLSTCVKILAAYDSSFAEQSEIIAKQLPTVFSEVAQTALTSLRNELPLVMRKLDRGAPYASRQIQEFVANTGDKQFQTSWNLLVRDLLRIADSHPEAWAAYASHDL